MAMAVNFPNLKISQLRALVAVAEWGTLSEAALQLGISQSAVSHAIASLETELGVLLLKRGRNGAYPTAVGERLLVQARQILTLLSEMVKQANLEKGLQAGEVRITAFRSVASRLLPKVISRFRRRFPQIAVVVTEVDEHFEMEQALRSGHADIGFADLPCSEDLETFELLKDEYIVLLPPTAQVNSSPLTWEQLASYPLIISSINSCSVKTRNCLKKSKILANVAYEIRQDSTIVSMVLQGLGAAIIPRLAAEPIPDRLKVNHLPILLERTIVAVVLKDALRTPAVFAFLDDIKNTGQFSLDFDEHLA